ncbi:MAG TPA: DoxX family protein [Candidatus Angelobacter sp.]|nr:DoxX family protein [Candidatus Angelobacter sp.]
MKFLKRFEPAAYAFMRIVTGFLFACHGADLLFGAFGGHPVWHHALLVAAGIIELGAGVLVLLGLQTRFAAFLASGEMAFAYFMEHARKSFFPISNGGELSVLYCFLFLFIATRGTERWGVEK